MWQQWAIFFPKKTFVIVASTFVFVLDRLRISPRKINHLPWSWVMSRYPWVVPAIRDPNHWNPWSTIYIVAQCLNYVISHLAVGGKREGGAKKGIASVHTHFQRVLGVHELQKHHQKLVLILRRPHLIPATTFRSRI